MLNPTASPSTRFETLIDVFGDILASRKSRVLGLVAVIIALSATDLYLTLMYSSTIGMPEMNPLARVLMRHGSVLDLILWKAGTVALCVGILIRLRERRAAEIGAWIAFLVLIALTLQWLAYTNLHQTIADLGPGLSYEMAATDEPNWVEISSVPVLD